MRAGYQCYYDTCTRNGINPVDVASYQLKWHNPDLTNREIWATMHEDRIAAIAVLWTCGNFVEILSTQSANEYLKDYPNHALFYTILSEFLKRPDIESVSYGLSSVQSESKRESLHQFKLSVGFSAIPVIRHIEVNPAYKPFVNKVSLSFVKAVTRLAPGNRHIKAARGALELIMAAEPAHN